MMEKLLLCFFKEPSKMAYFPPLSQVKEIFWIQFRMSFTKNGSFLQECMMKVCRQGAPYWFHLASFL